MGDGHTDVDQDRNLSERLSSLLGIESKLILESDFCADLRLDDAKDLLRQWTAYSRMKRGYNLSAREELAHLHILVLGDYLEGRVDSGKLWAVLTGNLPDYMKTKDDAERVKGYIEKYAGED
jgi:hypothetical protein